MKSKPEVCDCTVLGLHREMEHVSPIPAERRPLIGFLLGAGRVVSANPDTHYAAITLLMLASDASRHTGFHLLHDENPLTDFLKLRQLRVARAGVGTFLTRRPQQSFCQVRSLKPDASGDVHTASSTVN